MTWMRWVDKPRGMLLVDEDIFHRGGGDLLGTLKKHGRVEIKKMIVNWSTEKWNQPKR